MTTVLIVAIAALAGGERPFFSVEAKQDANPADYLPCDIGDRWVYNKQYATAMGPEAWMVKAIWTSTIEVSERVVIPEGLVIVSTQKTSDLEYETPPDLPEADLTWVKTQFSDRDETNYQLLAGPYVHNVPAWEWDTEKKSLSDRYREELMRGESTPRFFFPLDTAKMWTNKARETADHKASQLWKAGKGPAPNPGMYYWHYLDVEGVTLPLGSLDDVHHFKWFDYTGHTDVWFKDGVGVVKEIYEHNGSYIESSDELVAFTKGTAPEAPARE